MDRKVESTTPFNIHFQLKREKGRKRFLCLHRTASLNKTDTKQAGVCPPAVIVGIDLLQVTPSLAGRCRELGLHSLPDTHEAHPAPGGVLRAVSLSVPVSRVRVAEHLT